LSHLFLQPARSAGYDCGRVVLFLTWDAMQCSPFEGAKNRAAAGLSIALPLHTVCVVICFLDSGEKKGFTAIPGHSSNSQLEWPLPERLL
jgi:hypothetical protein